MPWVLGHDDHEIEERSGLLFCLTCDREVPRAGEPEESVSVEPELHDEDLGIDMRVRTTW